MSMPYSLVRFAVVVGAAALLSGAAKAVVPPPASTQGAPIVVAVGGAGTLEGWPLGPGWHPHPQRIAGLGGLAPSSIVANGDQVFIADGHQLIAYNLSTHLKTTMPNPAGIGEDLAIGKSGTLYVLNYTQGSGGNVAVFPSNGRPSVVNCGLLSDPSYIAVDNEGDVFVDQQSDSSFVVEIPAAPGGLDGAHCHALQLTPRQTGYAAGITVEPKTDDLLVLDDPGECAGGTEGRLTTYGRPYSQHRGRSIVVGQNCSGLLRLDASSRLVFVSDESVDGSTSFILTSRYPSGTAFGSFGGGQPSGFTTIPNTLPN
jgi:hypothetical protein